MKKITVYVMISLLVFGCSACESGKGMDYMSWWGNTGAKTGTRCDSQGRSRYWCGLKRRLPIMTILNCGVTA
jgi:hypothetical protein